LICKNNPVGFSKPVRIEYEKTLQNLILQGFVFCKKKLTFAKSLKLIKMKKNLFRVSLFVVLATLISCSGDNDVEKTTEFNQTLSNNEINYETLSENQDFVSLIEEMALYSTELKTVILKNNLVQEELTSRINDIQNNNLSPEQQLKEINKVFNFDVTKFTLNHEHKYKFYLNRLNIKIEEVPFDVLEHEINQVLSNKTDGSSIGSGGDCDYRYYLCMGGVYAVAITCHATCDSAAVLGTAGTALPVCFLACGTAAAYGSVLCSDNHCK
jgi:hypothetical protein